MALMLHNVPDNYFLSGYVVMLRTRNNFCLNPVPNRHPIPYPEPRNRNITIFYLENECVRIRERETENAKPRTRTLTRGREHGKRERQSFLPGTGKTAFFLYLFGEK